MLDTLALEAVKAVAICPGDVARHRSVRDDVSCDGARRGFSESGDARCVERRRCSCTPRFVAARGHVSGGSFDVRLMVLQEGNERRHKTRLALPKDCVVLRTKVLTPRGNDLFPVLGPVVAARA